MVKFEKGDEVLFKQTGEITFIAKTTKERIIIEYSRGWRATDATGEDKEYLKNYNAKKSNRFFNVFETEITLIKKAIKPIKQNGNITN